MFNISDIIRITAAEASCCDPDIRIDSISTDSRRIKRNEIFLALKGENYDGAQFIGEAIRKGACAIIAQKGDIVSEQIPSIRVDDTLRAFSDIAKAHREKFRIPVIGIVGSNGKTTTKDMLSYILERELNVLKTQDNLNNKVGVAKTLLRLKNEKIAVVEVGTSFLGEIEYNSKILLPTVVITTNIGLAHLKGLSTKEGVLKEKIAMVKSLGENGVWIRNCDDEMLLKENHDGIKIISFGIKNNDADFKAESVRQTVQGMEFFLNGKLIRLPLLGRHNVYNALAAIATASLFMDISKSEDIFAGFRNAPMRMEVINCGDCIIINDAYNANPISFECAVISLKECKTKGKRILCCGDMLELGDNSETFHYNCGRFLAQAKAADFLIAFGDKALFIAKGAADNGMDEGRIKVFTNKSHIACFLREIINKGDIVLVKGSRSMKMEEIVDCFTTCSIH